MAAPNIINATTITGVSTSFTNISNVSNTVIVSNAASSNQVFKVNTLVVANTTATAATVTIKYFTAASGGGTGSSIAGGIAVPAYTSLAIVGKDTPVYLEENRSITAISGSASSIDVVASYEVIS